MPEQSLGKEKCPLFLQRKLRTDFSKNDLSFHGLWLATLLCFVFDTFKSFSML